MTSVRLYTIVYGDTASRVKELIMHWFISDLEACCYSPGYSFAQLVEILLQDSCVHIPTSDLDQCNPEKTKDPCSGDPKHTVLERNLAFTPVREVLEKIKGKQ
ncbi:hypothetical protein TNCV_2536931 [Trichonephila clavipes]|nr:hypothetical protein TNCV_2536931 [Trichonephila clavipes]